MPCVNADGSLTTVGERVLGAARGALLDAESVARTAQVALYRARASLRELSAAGLLAERGGKYYITPAGEALLTGARDLRVG